MVAFLVEGHFFSGRLFFPDAGLKGKLAALNYSNKTGFSLRGSGEKKKLKFEIYDAHHDFELKAK